MVVLNSFKSRYAVTIYYYTLVSGFCNTTKIIANYAPQELLNVSDARDLAFRLDSLGNSLSCIYTGYTIQIEPEINIGRDAIRKNINIERPYPQRRGSRNFRGDVHNIFPCKRDVNTARSDLPFAEISEDEVIAWFRRERSTSPPREQIGEYSKLASDGFEPRDAAKGKIARAMFYVYTFYREQVDIEYFEQQKDTLRKWHQEYPPTEAEIERSRKVANSAQGNHNPFVLDPTLIERIYFTDESELKTCHFEVATIAIRLEFKIVTLVPKEQINNRPKPEDIYFREDVYYEAFSRKGRYQSYQELTNNEQEGIDYRIRFRQENSDVAIVAHHGGKIQLGTTEIADAIAGEDYSFYTFEGLKEDVENDPLHIPSHKFDEPRALELVSKADRVIAIHGIAVEDEAVYLGGLDDNFQEQIRQSLIKEDFIKIGDLGQSFRGISPQNICNRGQTGKGVQIGISWGLRKQLFDSLNNDSNEPTLFDRFIQAIRDALSPLEAAGWRYQITQGEADYYTEDLGDGIELEMISIPGGSFMMGTEEEEIERLVQKFDWEYFRAEKPQHEVTVQPFFMGKYPITQAQYQEVMGKNPSNFKGDERPVEQVSWDEAVEFCQRLSKQTGKEYRLPTEAEWEYACRAGTTTAFHFGETITDKLANYDASQIYAGEPKGEDRGETILVGSFPSNAFGLQDMHGNVWEWCEDDWHENYQDAPTDGTAWLSGESDTKVVHSGSWYGYPNNCRSASRGNSARVNRTDDLGFRVVCVVPRTT